MRTIERRLAEIEARLASQRLPAPMSGAPAWLDWIDDASLDWLEELCGRIEGGGPPATEAEQLRCLGIEAMALSRMASGEAP